MTDQESYEQWNKTTKKSELSRFEIWQTAKQDSAAEIKTLREIKIEQESRMKEMRADSAAEIAQLKERLTAYDKWLSEGVYYTTAEAFELHDDYNSQIAQLQADNLKLRDLLGDVHMQADYYHMDSGYALRDKIDEALASTPAQSLQAHDDELIEQCAVVCDKLYAKNVGNAIRELKGKP